MIKIFVFLLAVGGSIECIFINSKEIIDQKYYNFGAVDITNSFNSLKEDKPTVTFEEVHKYIDNLIGNIDTKANVLILAGGNHLYWYDNAKFKLLKNELFLSNNKKYMITRELGDKYDKEAFIISLDSIRKNSDNPNWFDNVRAMRTIVNVISHKINAKYIIPTKINMEDGLKNKLQHI